MAEHSCKDETAAAASKKWACSYCTYLNWEASVKCILCYQLRNKPMLIEELRHSNESSTSVFPDDEEFLAAAFGAEEVRRWPCPTCTYQNCQRTRHCIQCFTDRPVRYATPPNSVSSSIIQLHHQKPPAIHLHPPPQHHQNQQQQQHHVNKYDHQFISRALNKWTCPICTFDNWPNAAKCTLCANRRLVVVRGQSQSPPQEGEAPKPQRKRSETRHQRIERTESRDHVVLTDRELERFEHLSIGGGQPRKHPERDVGDED